MSKNYDQEAIEFIKRHRLLTLATADQDGTPYACTLGYAADGTTIYFATSNETKKMRNIKDNPNVSYTIDEEQIDDWSTLQAIQMLGKASIVNNPDEIKKAAELLTDQFPELEDMPPDDTMVYVKIEPKKGKFMDNSVHFGFSVDLTY